MKDRTEDSRMSAAFSLQNFGQLDSKKHGKHLQNVGNNDKMMQ